MPLLDHFHPPVFTERHWEGFHSQWAGCIAGRLNQSLPEHYFAEPQTSFGTQVEVDTAVYERPVRAARVHEEGNGGVAVLAAEPQVQAPPAPAAVMSALFPESVEVLVYSTAAGPTLVAAVELVSPGNKDRPEERQAFVAKCATYLHSGVGLMIVDIVTNRLANLHNQLLEFLGHPSAFDLPAPSLFASVFRPSHNPRHSPPPTDRIEIWASTFAVGQPLPLHYLPLDRRQFVPLDLEATYTEARQRSRLG